VPAFRWQTHFRVAVSISELRCNQRLINALCENAALTGGLTGKYPQSSEAACTLRLTLPQGEGLGETGALRPNTKRPRKRRVGKA